MDTPKFIKKKFAWPDKLLRRSEFTFFLGNILIGLYPAHTHHIIVTGRAERQRSMTNSVALKPSLATFLNDARYATTKMAARFIAKTAMHLLSFGRFACSSEA